jgi:hypothetical protein
MKRFIPLLLAVILIYAGCTFTPFDSSDYSSIFETTVSGKVAIKQPVPSSLPSDSGKIEDSDTIAPDVQGIIFIYFTDYLDASTVTEGNFVISGNSISGTAKDITVEYEKNFKRVKITGTFSLNATFTLKIVADKVKSAGGNYLDGNGNNIEDGSPYDDIYYQFRTQGGTGFKDYDNPVLTWLGPNRGNTRLSDTIRVFFSETVDSADLVNNISLKVEGGAEYTLKLLHYYGNYAFFRVAGVDTLLADFAERKAYIIEINLAEITDSAGNVCIPYNTVYTSENPVYSVRFVTRSTHGDDATPPTVQSATLPDSSDFMTITFNEAMDISTLTSDNIKLYANFGNGMVYVPGEIYIHPDSIVVEYSLINMDWANVTAKKLIISKDVTDNSFDKWNLDNNDNAMGGEDADPSRIWENYSFPYNVIDYTDSDNYIRTF